jgi:dTDP-4-amino-4,6-dideoxygalactose transaminase
MRVPFLDLKMQLGAIRGEVTAAVARVLEGGTYILGEEVRAFEAEWASFCGAAGAVAVASGTDALVLALKASGAAREGRSDEVVTTSLTAGYTALAIQLAGGRPVFADIDRRDYTLDPQSIEDAITPRTRAIVPVHLYGRMADMASIRSIADRRGLVLVEDAAQAHGARRDGKPAGSWGDAAAFSFYPTKNLGAFGDGGIITARDGAVLRRARTLRQGGHPEAFRESGAEMGLNSRLDEMQAAILRVKLPYLDAWNEQRRKLASFYGRALEGVRSLQLPDAGDPEWHVFYLYVVGHPRRDELRAHLAAHGVETLIHYPFLLHQQARFRDPRQGPLPVVEAVQPTILSLPLHPWLRADEAGHVAEVLAAFGAGRP